MRARLSDRDSAPSVNSPPRLQPAAQAHQQEPDSIPFRKHNAKTMYNQPAMSDFLNQIAAKFGMTHEELEGKAGDVLDQFRDKIPDSIEGQIDEALHGDMLDQLKSKFAPEGSAIDGILDNFLGDAKPAEETTTEEAQ